MIKRVGVISDTHGLVRPEVLDALNKSDMIIHAGDIGKYEVLETLSKVAPVVAVRGNCDKDKWANNIPETENVIVNNVSIHVVHNKHNIDYNLKKLGYNIVISGHSHKPSRYMENEVLFINPGSIGPRRFKLPISFAIITFTDKLFEVEFINI